MSGEPRPATNPQAELRHIAGLFSDGQFAEADRAAAKLLKQIPRVAVLHNIQGAARLSLGRFDQAEASFRRALAIDPASADAHNNLGNLYLQRGDGAAALKKFRLALQHRPGFTEAEANTGHALLLLHEVEYALDSFDAALSRRPDFANALFGRGLCLQSLDRHADAAAALEAAMAKNFAPPELLAALGLSRAKLGDREVALKAIDTAFRLAPERVGTLCGMGETLLDLEEPGPALECFARAEGLAPEDTRPAIGAGNAQFALKDYAAAAAAFRKAVVLGTRTESLFNSLAEALADTGNVDAALEAHRTAIELAPDSPLAHERYADTLMRFGRFDEANAALDRAIALDRAPGRLFHNYVRTRNFTGKEPIIEAVIGRFNDASTPDEDKVHIGFGLAKALEDAGRLNEVFTYLDAANTLQRRTIDQSIGDVLSRLDMLRQTFSSEALARRAGHGNPDNAPIFIVGMPRSGTTLLEQILFSHSRVTAAGEREDLRRLAIAHVFGGSQVNTDAFDLSPHTLRGIADAYLAAIRQDHPDGDFVTDKMPHNFRWVGLIHLALPNATILHMKRDPRDVCLSIYKNMFKPGQHVYGYDQRELGAYYKAYEKLMHHWEEVLPGKIHAVEYQRLVGDPETEIRRVLDICGLEFEDACLHAHRAERGILTLSQFQARQPIYKSSLAAWKKYERDLAPLLEVLRVGD